jgi:hypothetical protein
MDSGISSEPTGPSDRSPNWETDRRLTLSILKSDTTVTDSVRGKHLLAGWNLDNLEGILTAFQAV